MLRSIGVAAVGLCATLWTHAAQADATTIPQWAVDYRDSRSTTVCVLSARLQNGSVFDLKVFGERNVALLTISSPKWRTPELGRPHSVSARFSQDPKIGFRTTEALGGVEGVIFVVGTPFLQRLPGERSVTFSLGGEAEVAEFNLSDAKGSLRALERCVMSRFGAYRVAQRFEKMGWSSPSG